MTTQSFTHQLYTLTYCGLILNVFIYIFFLAYRIRLNSIDEYGFIIHEFDPYFNYRATEYLYENGWHSFRHWFDTKVWYPLGRPVGTTIYPGMQVTACLVKWMLKGVSLNSVCCLIPAWFGSLATLFTGLLGYECSLYSCRGSLVCGLPVVGGWYESWLEWWEKEEGDVDEEEEDFELGEERISSWSLDPLSPSMEVGVFSAGFMSIVPAHLMRSVGGGYDNESVAITAMVMTFWLWVRSLREGECGVMWGTLCGVSYFYMASVWGGYIFVLNLVGLHAFCLILWGRFCVKLYRSYSMFYVVGTILAMQVPVVGTNPIKSMEQMGPLVVFVFMQIMTFHTYLHAKYKLSSVQSTSLLVSLMIATVIVLLILAQLLLPSGYFGPISSRVRGLFIPHTKTGNPLVDSVAEHQPASTDAYFQYLHFLCFLQPIGLFQVFFFYFDDASSFLVVYFVTAYFFSKKMVRLILLTAPIASVIGGVVMGRFFTWTVSTVIPIKPTMADLMEDLEEEQPAPIAEAEPVIVTAQLVHATTYKARNKNNNSNSNNTNNKKNNRHNNYHKHQQTIAPPSPKKFNYMLKIIKFLVSVTICQSLYLYGKDFYTYCWTMSKQISHPTIVFKAETTQGDIVTVDDYRDAYFWLRHNTPQDSRILAWWDYGYQITAMSNRTTIADGNTWNHEHIALLGRILTSSEKEGHRIARHLADYVLVWAGGGGDDLAKSPHLARIANSVYRDVCPNDPSCRAFGFVDHYGTPSKMMEESFLYKLHSHNLKPNVVADRNRFKEVYSSKYGKVRIFKILGVSKESKDWVADPANRICDVPGSWLCRGQYPPALRKVLSLKRDFAQLEDFNSIHSDNDYHSAYLESLTPKKAPQPSSDTIEEGDANEDTDNDPDLVFENDDNDVEYDDDEEISDVEITASPPITKLTPQEIATISSHWEDSDETTLLYQLISQNEVQDLKNWIKEDPRVAYLRSGDGRGPMWWAYEYEREEIVKILLKKGVGYLDKDVYGLAPLDMLEND
mmetsp:Transcript_41640/g.50670  ORF Transcript_41640/g.50670 Transcript_41640/m.50670 type:complete len:1014 (-) Transcript_41640:84-3125(-)|eukprot:CAMPEP_0172506976 /NCGR_PEP_ID=MMETSP1066-20121228/200116_1 /TAXON_ID=671091 /ORGANISM="Coscinodiscus wailesii, Strain CCMP2513" /LENGTH=1013 /DNA_ID=CAMNT_0013284299 /DNA_START=231 /DNA_END=3272 /DNA_ORIENTATION=-